MPRNIVIFWRWDRPRPRYRLPRAADQRHLQDVSRVITPGSWGRPGPCASSADPMDGRLWATANVPHGATLQFTLPMNADAAS